MIELITSFLLTHCTTTLTTLLAKHCFSLQDERFPKGIGIEGKCTWWAGKTSCAHLFSFAPYYKALAKRSQHFNATYRNIVTRCNRVAKLEQHVAPNKLLGATYCSSLDTLLRRVATCWLLVAANLKKWSNFSGNICGCCMTLQLFGQVRSTMLGLDMRTSSMFSTQHVATRRNRVAQTSPACCAQQCYVEMCSVEILLLFGRGLRSQSGACAESGCCTYSSPFC